LEEVRDSGERFPATRGKVGYMATSRGVRGAMTRELRRMGSKPLYTVVTVVLPLVSFLIVWAIFSEGVARDLPIAMCDQDHSALSRKIVRMLDASPGIAVAGHADDPEVGHALIRQGRAYALVVLPAHFERDVLAGKAPRIICFYNNELLVPGSLVSRDIRNVIGTISAGFEFRLKQRQAKATAVNPGAIEPIKIEQHPLFNPYLNYAYFLVTALVPTVLQIFIVVMSAYAIGSELRDATGREWLDSAGGSPWKAVLGKLLPYSVIFGALGFVMITLVFFLLGVPLRGSVGLILASTLLFVIVYEVVGLFIVSLTANLRLSLNFAAFYSAPAFAFVGITFPSVGLPQLAKTWAAILPLFYYLKILIDQGIRGTAAANAVSPLLILAAFIPVMLILPALRMRKLMTEEKYWGRT
jgi:ABC-2 type transport system permease protein